MRRAPAAAPLLPLAALACGALSCGAGKTAKETNAPKGVVLEAGPMESYPEATVEGGTEEEMEAEGIVPTMNKVDVDGTMQDSGALHLHGCLVWIYNKQRDFVYGELRFSIRVATDGSVEKLTIARSTVGDWELEKCVKDKFLAMTFPPPSGGSFDLDYTYNIDLPAGTKKPGAASPAAVKDALAGFKKRMNACAGKPIKKTKLIFYIGETFEEEVQEGRKTKVHTYSRLVTFGAATSEKPGDEALACIADEAKEWKIPYDAGNYVQKVTVAY